MAIESGIATLGASGWVINPGYVQGIGTKFDESWLLIGDSLMARNNRGGAVASVSWAGGFATVTTTLAHGLYQGAPLRYTGVTGSASQALDGERTVYSIQSTTVFVMTCPAGISGSAATADGWFELGSFFDGGFFNWANAFANQRFNVPLSGYAGIGGDSSLGVATRIAGYLARDSYTNCCIMVGVNDALNSIASATTFARIMTAVAVCQSFNVKPTVVTVLPLGVGHGSFATATPLINSTNKLLRSAASSGNDFKLIDGHAAMVNTANGAAIPLTIIADNTHLSKLGAKMVGKAFADSWGTHPPCPLLIDNAADTFANNPLNMLDSAPWASEGTVGAGITEAAGGTSIGAGWTVARLSGTGTGVASLVPRTVVADGDAIGVKQRVVWTPGSAADVLWAFNNSSLNTRMAAGSSYELRGVVALANLAGSNINGLTVQGQYNFVDTISAFAYTYSHYAFATGDTIANMDHSAPLGNLNTADVTLTVRSGKFVCPSAVQAGGNGPNIRLSSITAAGTAVTLDFSRMSLDKVA